MSFGLSGSNARTSRAHEPFGARKRAKGLMNIRPNPRRVISREKARSALPLLLCAANPPAASHLARRKPTPPPPPAPPPGQGETPPPPPAAAAALRYQTVDPLKVPENSLAPRKAG